mmetsp:Transcript_6917/g.13801  ORF Transcript_6917/g.13801 Transcript_6917/m.13801 type:complete len:312 (-) Transcript_6917:102-1037(-)
MLHGRGGFTDASRARQNHALRRRMSGVKPLAHYADHLANDPNLRGVTTLAELHERLSSLSAALAASDQASSVFKQLTFPTAAGEGHPSPVFVPNRFKKDLSTDGVRIGQHYRYAVKAEEHVVQALEYSCETVPSVIIAADDAGATDGHGALFHGGYRCVANASFLRSHRVRRVVNTAINLGSFFVKFPQSVAAAEQEGVVFLHLGWTDSEEQEVGEQALLDACRFVHEARRAGDGVLVHCAQGKSRSATVVTAYVAALHALPVAEALAKVQAGRRMAEPNANFMRQLLAHERAGVFARLHQEWSNFHPIIQ